MNRGPESRHVDTLRDFFKCAAGTLAETTSSFNDAMDIHEQLDLGKGVLVIIQNRDKLEDPLMSLAPGDIVSRRSIEDRADR